MAIVSQTVLNASVRAGIIDSEMAAKIRQEVREKELDPIEAISSRGRIPVSAIYRAVAEDKGIPYYNGESLNPQPELLKKIPSSLIQRKLILPVVETTDEIFVASSYMEESEYRQMRESLRVVVKKAIKFVMANPDDLKFAIEKALRLINKDNIVVIQNIGDTVKFVNRMIKEAFIWCASDIHIEPEERYFRIRFRVDGILQVYKAGLSREAAYTILSRVKVLGGLDIAETREFQDGSFTYTIEDLEGEKVDIRLATAPTRYGERATLRIFAIDSRVLTLEMLGFPSDIYHQFEKMIQRPHGLILITGPTGSGKTTTLYAALRVINQPGRNIMTVENPVEYPIEGVSQIQTDSVGKVTFAGALRSLLRHDPDVMMVGEIRDLETAGIALRASITGHMVFSTLHTNTACGTITRLIDMGCEPFLLASTLTTSIAQRLVRRLCPFCKRSTTLSEEDRNFVGKQEKDLCVYEAVGCINCHGTGYQGRVGVFEMIRVDKNLRRVIAQGSDEDKIEQAAEYMTTLYDDAVEKVLAGVISLNEAKRVIVSRED